MCQKLGNSSSSSRLWPAPSDHHRGLGPFAPGYPTSQSTTAETVRLTKRQREVLRLIAGGQLNRQIALLLGIAERTVELHVTLSPAPSLEKLRETTDR